MRGLNMYMTNMLFFLRCMGKLLFILVLNDCFHIDFSTFRRDLHFLNIKARLISFLKFSKSEILIKYLMQVSQV